MAYDIGTARGVIELEYNGRGIDEAQQDLQGIEKSGGGATAAAAGAAKGIQRAGLVIAGALGAGVYAAANFEQRMSAIGAVSGATGDELDKLRDKALQLGKDTQFSASESAQAMEELVKAGLSVSDVLNGAADATVALAAAGEVDMPTAATIASNAMNQFNLAAKDMVGVADSIAGAANASAIDVGDFGESLQQVGAVANLAGLSFEDTATAIALMGNAGIRGSDAGTSLKSMLSRLQPTTKKQADVMKELGLNTEKAGNQFYDAQGNLKSLSDISGILSKSLRGMTKQQKQAALQTMFGSDAIRAAAVLANNGAKGFDKMAKSMGEVGAQEVAQKRMDNFKGSLEQLKGSLETVGIALGSVLIPALRDLVDGLTQALNWFLNLSSGQQKFIAVSAATVAGVLLIVAQLIKLILWGRKVQIMLAGTRLAFLGTWAAALGPIALVVAAVAAVIAIIVILWKKSETFRSIVLAVWGAIKAAIQAVADWFTGTFVPFWVGGWNTLVSAIKAAWGFITSVVKAGIGLIKSIITAYLTAIIAVWGALWGTFGPLIKAVWGLIVAIIRLGWTIIKGLFILNMRAIKAVLQGGWNAIKAVTSAVWGAIKAVISAVWGVIGGTVTRNVARVRSVISAAWNFLKGATSAAWKALVSIIGDHVSRAVELVSNLKSKITGFFSGAASWLYNAGKEIIQGLINGISSMIGKVTSMINSVTDKIGKFLPGSPVKEGPLKKLNRGRAGKQIVEMIIEGLSDMVGPLARAMNDTVSVAVPTGYATPEATVLAKPRRVGGGGARRNVRLVSGELRLDKSGRAFIRGVAEDADDDGDDFDDLLGRMG